MDSVPNVVGRYEVDFDGIAEKCWNLFMEARPRNL